MNFRKDSIDNMPLAAKLRWFSTICSFELF